MPIVNDFEYFRPKTAEEACGLLRRFGDRARVLAGGTDLVNGLKDGDLKPEAVIDIKGIQDLKDLRRLEFDGKRLWIGALVTFNEIVESKTVNKEFPLLMECSHCVGSSGLRNRATMVGNICAAVPCLDSGPNLLVYEAVVHIARAGGDRKLPLEEFLVAPRKTALKPGEFVTGVSVPLPGKKHAACYVKLGRYRGEDLAQASVAVLVTDGEVRVAFGSVGPVPARARKIEKLLGARKITPKLVEEARKLVAKTVSPISDIRSSKEYRLHMCGVMLERGLRAAQARLAGKGPRYGINLV